ncbi:MAG: hypothetical protein H6Q86_1553 [candidate division NC10 bacterium]|jgi:uncharacterized protein (UPF0332 family)|nr:hypothetical protein [candidate division NC10 bacterium]
MMTDNLAALVRYRIEQAEEALHAARILLREGSLRGSVNRSYYAMFYAVLALLASRKEETSKHSGVIALFDRLYVRTEVFPTDFSKWLRRAFDLRTRCDYGTTLTVTTEETASQIEHASSFLSAVREECQRLINSS